MYRDSSSPLSRFAAAVGMLAVAVAALSGCGQGTSPTEPFAAQTATLAVKQTAALAKGVAVSFDRVVSDSRCPSGVVCVWEGEVTVALTLSESDGPVAFTLSDDSPTRVVGGYTFELVSVQPSPVAGTATPENAYRATIRVSR